MVNFVYVLNTLLIPVDFDRHKEADVRVSKITVDEARELLRGGFVSAVGHQGTAELLSRILNIPIPTQRISVYFEPGDIGVHFFLKERLPEGQVLQNDEVSKLQYWLVKSEVMVSGGGLSGKTRE